MAAKKSDEKTGDATDKGAKADEKPVGGKRRKSGGTSFDVGAEATRLRNIAATVVWLLAVVAAAFLAVGALLIALDFNRQNGFVEFVTDTADTLNFLGVMKEFKPEGKGADAQQSALVKNVLVNWGICAVVWLVAGKVIERLVRP